MRLRKRGGEKKLRTESEWSRELETKRERWGKRDKGKRWRDKQREMERDKETESRIKER